MKDRLPEIMSIVNSVWRKSVIIPVRNIMGIALRMNITGFVSNVFRISRKNLTGN